MVDRISSYRAFLTVAEAGSISEAARRMFLSQPAVSSEIAALESRLDVKLFFRTNRGIALTPEGELLSRYAREALSLIDAGEEKLREITGLRGGLLRIGASDMTLRFFLLDYIEEFRKTYPDVKITVTNAPTPRTLASLRSGKIDFGVVTSPIDGEDGIEAVPVRRINDIFVSAEGLPLAKKKKVRAEDFAACPLMMLEGRTSTRDYVASMMGPSFPAPDIELATSDLLLSFALRGIGVASIVEDFAAADIAAGRLCKIDLARPLPPRDFLLVYMKNLPLGAAAKQMIQMIRKDAPKQIEND